MAISVLYITMGAKRIAMVKTPKSAPNNTPNLPKKLPFGFSIAAPGSTAEGLSWLSLIKKSPFLSDYQTQKEGEANAYASIIWIR